MTGSTRKILDLYDKTLLQNNCDSEISYYLQLERFFSVAEEHSPLRRSNSGVNEIFWFKVGPIESF